MASRIEVREIETAETIPIRWSVLRPGFPPETAQFLGDDAPGTRHFGAFLDGQLAGVASLYNAGLPGTLSPERGRQLRGMATSPEARGAGCGRALLAACVAAAEEEGCALLWCNARTSAVDFYRNHGWVVCSDEFDIPTVGPHFRMRRTLLAPN
jgi:L-Ala-D/L-Glu epimerase